MSPAESPQDGSPPGHPSLLSRAVEKGSKLGIGPVVGIASTYLAARYLGAWAAAFVSGLWAAIVGLWWSRRVAEMGRSIEHYSRLALLDDLTAIANDRSFREGLARYSTLAGQSGEVFSLVLVDIDEFKPYNDTFGHSAGDDALRRFGRCLVSNSGEDARVYRVGGDEFALIVPNAGQAAALAIAERMRAALGGRVWPHRPITASFGVAQIADGSDPIVRADRALYRAKAMGGDRVVADQAEDASTPE